MKLKDEDNPLPPQPYNSIKLDKGWVERRDSPSELRRTLTELRQTPDELRHTLHSYAAPYTEQRQRRILLSYDVPWLRHAAPNRSTPHPDWACTLWINLKLED